MGESAGGLLLLPDLFQWLTDWEISAYFIIYVFINSFKYLLFVIFLQLLTCKQLSDKSEGSANCLI